MSASFNSSGKVPDAMHSLKQEVKNGVHEAAAILSTGVGIFPLTDFELSRLKMALKTLTKF